MAKELKHSWFTVTHVSEPNIVQYTVTVLLIGMPMLYMQMIIGQYTQQSGTYLKYMCPVGHGIGYCFLLTTLFHVVPNGVLAGDCLLYLFNCFQLHLPWLHCANDSAQDCFTLGQCTSDDGCVSDKVLPATHVFWNTTFMEMKSSTNSVVIRRLVMIIVVWVVVYFILINMVAFSKRIMVYFFVFATSSLILIMFTLLNNKGVTHGIIDQLEIKFRDFTNVNAWLQSVTDTNMMLCLSKGGQILIGSYLDSTSNSGILSVITAVLIMFVNYVLIFLGSICLAILEEAFKVPKSKLLEIPYFFKAGELTIIPGAFGFTAVPQVVSILYFGACVIYCVSTIIINIKVIEISLVDGHPKFARYRVYLLFFIIAACLVCSLTFVYNELFQYTSEHYDAFLGAYDNLIAFIFLVMVSWLYGVQHLADDMHFIMGSQPTHFWKIFWYILPVVLGAATLQQIRLLLMLSYKLYSMLMLSALCSPLVIMAIIEIFRYMKRRNLLGLLQPDERWGRPLATERELREIFNPRKETRSRRRNDTCKHKCLLNSKVLKKIANENLVFRIYNSEI